MREPAAVLCLGTLFNLVAAGPIAESASKPAPPLRARWTERVGDRGGVAYCGNDKQRRYDKPNSSGPGALFRKRFEHGENAVFG